MSTQQAAMAKDEKDRYMFYVVLYTLRMVARVLRFKWFKPKQ